LLFHVFEPM